MSRPSPLTRDTRHIGQHHRARHKQQGQNRTTHWWIAQQRQHPTPSIEHPSHAHIRQVLHLHSISGDITILLHTPKHITINKCQEYKNRTKAHKRREPLPKRANLFACCLSSHFRRCPDSRARHRGGSPMLLAHFLMILNSPAKVLKPKTPAKTLPKKWLIHQKVNPLFLSLPLSPLNI